LYKVIKLKHSKYSSRVLTSVIILLTEGAIPMADDIQRVVKMGEGGR